MNFDAILTEKRATLLMLAEIGMTLSDEILSCQIHYFIIHYIEQSLIQCSVKKFEFQI